MPQNEITGKRPSSFSIFHREFLPKDYYMTDGDFFEQRLFHENLISIAYFETIQVPNVTSDIEERYPIWNSKKSLCFEIDNKMRIPAFVIWHNPDCTDFYIKRLKTNQHWKVNRDGFKAFLDLLWSNRDIIPLKPSGRVIQTFFKGKITALKELIFSS